MYLNTHIKGPGQPPGSPALSTFPSISPGTTAPHPRPGEGPVRAGGQRGASTPPPHFGGSNCTHTAGQEQGGTHGSPRCVLEGAGVPTLLCAPRWAGSTGLQPPVKQERPQHVRALRARRNPRIPSDLQPRGVFFLLFSARIRPGPHGEPKDPIPGGILVVPQQRQERAAAQAPPDARRATHAATRPRAPAAPTCLNCSS